jgi:hypothetical protein
VQFRVTFIKAVFKFIQLKTPPTRARKPSITIDQTTAKGAIDGFLRSRGYLTAMWKGLLADGIGVVLVKYSIA